MNKKLRTLIVWIVVSLILQFGGYSLLNKQMEQVLGTSGTDNEPAITTKFEATVPGTGLSNIQVSYAKDYIAYMENNVLKVFNLKKGTIVFEKKPPSAQDQTLGVLNYQWLPDRNILLYFYARKNPNAVTTVKVYPAKPEVSTLTISPNTEDPKQEKAVPKTSLQPKLEKRYGNPQLTELYSLELPDSDEDAAPDDRLNPFESGSKEFPAGGKIENFVVSPVTNLMYLTVKTGSKQQLMKIDVMKKVSILSQSQEQIDNMAASDRFGTLYIDSKLGALQQITAIQYDTALQKNKRYTITKNASDRILGVRKGKVYIGEVTNNQLVKIKTTSDLPDVKENPSFKTEWEGSIPFNPNTRTITGAGGQIIVYDNQKAYVVKDGHLKEVTLQGDENYCSADGAELIQLKKKGTSTLVKLQPLEQLP
ncbi:hypothetical protein [Desulfosporosinus sp. FKA]|uniref:hypothetical protein n=1 Tax=Desulfosporosinus sp. FKA TaxID=1969834 RepID=UPI000B49E92E|nr:hypothetical protein [Desulfosporosinus sp. FKA]